MPRFKDHNWDIIPRPDGRVSHEDAKFAVLMDLRDELKSQTRELQHLTRILGCHNFLRVPEVLDSIQKNTAKPRRRAKRKVSK